MFHGAEGNGSPYYTGLTACPAHRAARPAATAKYSMFLLGLIDASCWKKRVEESVAWEQEGLGNRFLSCLLSRVSTVF